MFCPNCGSEFRTGFLHCDDCDAALVERLPSSEEAVHPGTPSVVFVTGDAQEANLVRTLLEASGIEAELLDENTMTVYVPLVVANGGIRVVVPADQEQAAKEILEIYRGQAGQDPSQGGFSPFEHFGQPEPPETTEPANEEFRCAHCDALLEVETTLCPGCGREPW